VIVSDLPRSAQGTDSDFNPYQPLNLANSPPAQARPVFERALELGLGVRIHIGQFADVGGAELALAMRAASVEQPSFSQDSAPLSVHFSRVMGRSDRLVLRSGPPSWRGNAPDTLAEPGDTRNGPVLGDRRV